MSEPIRSFWIEGELTQHQLLTVHSFLRHGHHFVLYAYDVPAGLPPAVEVRDLNEFVPRSEVFYYRNMDHERRLGGFCERVKAELLYQLGGWHVDMDVTCLRPFDLTAEFVLRPHHRLVVANIIRCPPRCELARIYRDGARQVDAGNGDWERSFAGLAEGVRSLGLERFIVDDSIFGRDDGDWPQFLKATGGCPDSSRYAIHWCGTYGRYRNAERGSFYDSLLTSYGLG
jgi:hypothetical protein